WHYELKLISQYLRYQWYKDGDIIPGVTGATLLIPLLTADSAGQYTVTVTDLYPVRRRRSQSFRPRRPRCALCDWAGPGKSSSPGTTQISFWNRPRRWGVPGIIRPALRLPTSSLPTIRTSFSACVRSITL